MELDLVCLMLNHLKLNSTSLDLSDVPSCEINFLCNLFEGLSISDEGCEPVPSEIHHCETIGTADQLGINYCLSAAGSSFGIDSGISINSQVIGKSTSADSDAYGQVNSADLILKTDMGFVGNGPLCYNKAYSMVLSSGEICPSSLRSDTRILILDRYDILAIVLLLLIVLHQIYLDSYYFELKDMETSSFTSKAQYHLVLLHKNDVAVVLFLRSICRDVQVLVVSIIRISRQIKLDFYLFSCDWIGITTLGCYGWTICLEDGVTWYNQSPRSMPNCFNMVVIFIRTVVCDLVSLVAKISPEEHNNLFGMQFFLNHVGYCHSKNIWLDAYYYVASWQSFWVDLLMLVNSFIQLSPSSQSVSLISRNYWWVLNLRSCWVYLDVRPSSWFITGHGAWAVSSYTWYECGMSHAFCFKGIVWIFELLVIEGSPGLKMSLLKFFIRHLYSIQSVFLNA